MDTRFRNTMSRFNTQKILPRVETKRVRFLIDDQILEIGDNDLIYNKDIRKRKLGKQKRQNQSTRTDLDNLQRTLNDSKT